LLADDPNASSVTLTAQWNECAVSLNLVLPGLSLDYGVRSVSFFIQTLRLDKNFGTDPDDVKLQIINATGAEWSLTVEAAPLTASGSGDLAGLLFVGDDPIETGGGAEVLSDDSAAPYVEHTWSQLKTIGKDIVVKIGPETPGIEFGLEYQTLLTWSVIIEEP
jgi:hypothetical protein